ncbi:hypothetical protein RJT34_16499 [Clitoria ternatea]|uniref:Uncharacterized protein n=1 Tax=Clitoria ternatea TaxID=43366 RepID=A0AAN9PCD1_CLITE
MKESVLQSFYGRFWNLALRKNNKVKPMAILKGTVIREEVGLTLDKARKEVLGHASKVVLTKDTTTIVGDGSIQEVVNKRVA